MAASKNGRKLYMAKELIYNKYRETNDKVFLLTWDPAQAIAAAEKQNSRYGGKENEQLHRTSESFSSNFILYDGSGVMMIDAELVNSFRFIEECCKLPVLKKFVQANLTGSDEMPTTKKGLVQFIRNMFALDEYDRIVYADEVLEGSTASEKAESANDSRSGDYTDDPASKKRKVDA